MSSIDRPGMHRRDFGTTLAGAGAALALAGQLRGATNRPKEVRTLFFNLSHENHEGHEYALVVGKNRYILERATGSHPALASARQRNRLINSLPSHAITHVIPNLIYPADAVHASYLQKDANPNDGTWGMTAIFLLPPKSSIAHAYNRARAVAADGPLRLSAKRRRYGMPAAMTLQDLLDEQDVIDFTDFGTALVNLHPEMLSADPNTAAHIQTNHIQPLDSLGDVADQLQCAGTALPQGQTGTNVCGTAFVSSPGDSPNNSTGWATLVPYTDENGVPLKSNSPNNKGLILYDAKWQPSISVPWVSTAMQDASKRIKSDTTLGADVTAGRSNFQDKDLTGCIWFRNDATTSVDQAKARPRSVSANDTQFALSNLTPSFNGYSVDADVTVSGGNATVTLTFKNWYLRWLGLYIQFYDAGGNVVPAGQIPVKSPDNSFNTSDNEIFLGTLTPEFTIYGIPVQASGNKFTFTFPISVASSAKILASGLGTGSHTHPKTEILGIVMTSVFCLSLPLFLIVFGLGGYADLFSQQVVNPYSVLIVTEILNTVEGGTYDQFVAIFWRSIVRGILNPTGPLKAFFEAFAEYLAEAEITEAFEDAIPIVGAILQAVGSLAALAEVTETSCEVVLSPWTYEYSLVGTHNLPVSLAPDNTGFPAAAATGKITAIFDKGTPQTQTFAMPNNNQPIPVAFNNVPVGGNAAINAAFYTQDGTQVGHGSASGANGINQAIPVTMVQDLLPIKAGTLYQHKQKTSLDSQGNHVWVCAAAPAPPADQAACQSNPGNLCSLRDITVSGAGQVGYAWQSYSTSPCQSGSSQLDQLASLPIVNAQSGNAQGNYVLSSCAMGGATKLVYDPTARLDGQGHPSFNFYVDTSLNLNALRRVDLSAPEFDPTEKMAWGIFNLPPSDLLFHPAGAVVSIHTGTHRMETLRLPDNALADADAAVSLLATLHGGQGTRPGLFDTPTVSAITPEGVVLILEAGNNRLHAVDICGNPVRHFSKQPEQYFLGFTQTGGAGTQYLDLAVEFSGFIYVLSYRNPVYRLDIYHQDQTGTDPISTTTDFNAAKLVVDYWRNVYSLNYEVLKLSNGTVPAVTEPSISQWIPTAPPPCQGPPTVATVRSPSRKRLLRRRNFWKVVPA